MAFWFAARVAICAAILIGMTSAIKLSLLAHNGHFLFTRVTSESMQSLLSPHASSAQYVLGSRDIPSAPSWLRLLQGANRTLVLCGTAPEGAAVRLGVTAITRAAVETIDFAITADTQIANGTPLQMPL